MYGLHHSSRSTCTYTYIHVSRPTLCAALLDHHHHYHYLPHYHHYHYYYHYHYPTTSTTPSADATSTLLNLLCSSLVRSFFQAPRLFAHRAREGQWSARLHVILLLQHQKHRPALLKEEPAPPEACGAGAAAGDNLVSQISY